MLKAIVLFGGLLVSADEATDVSISDKALDDDEDPDFDKPGGKDEGPPDAEGEKQVEDKKDKTAFRFWKNGVWGLVKAAESEEDKKKVEVHAMAFGVNAFWEIGDNDTIVGKCKRKEDECNAHGTRFFRKALKTIKETRDEKLPGSKAEGHHVEVKHDVKEVGKFQLDVYFIKKEGEVGVDLKDNTAPSWDGKAGSLKFLMQFSDWKFCTADSCKEKKEGKFIDLRMYVKSKKASLGKKLVQRSKEKEAGGKGKRRYALKIGDTMEMDYTDVVKVDGEMKNMPRDDKDQPLYPMQSVQSRKIMGKEVKWTELRFRFPKFTSSMEYDPVVEGADEPESGAAFMGPGVAFLALVLALRA